MKCLNLMMQLMVVWLSITVWRVRGELESDDAFKNPPVIIEEFPVSEEAMLAKGKMMMVVVMVMTCVATASTGSRRTATPYTPQPGGYEAEGYTNKYMVSVFQRTDNKLATVGALLNPRVVISAAAGLRGHHHWEFKVAIHPHHAINKATALRLAQRHSLALIVRHDKFSVQRTPKNNLALLVLSQPAEVPRSGHHLALDGDNLSFVPGALTRMVGWSWANDTTLHDRVHDVQLPVQSHAACAYSHEYSVDRATEFCAGYPDRNHEALHFTSGAPLFHHTAQASVLVGLLSWTESYGIGHFPPVFTRLAAFHQWIVSTVDLINRCYPSPPSPEAYWANDPASDGHDDDGYGPFFCPTGNNV